MIKNGDVQVGGWKIKRAASYHIDKMLMDSQIDRNDQLISTRKKEEWKTRDDEHHDLSALVRIVLNESDVAGYSLQQKWPVTVATL